MHRTVMFLAASGLALTVISAGCSKNQPPAPPYLSGPTSGNIGDALTYTFSTTDPEGQEIAYMVAWGDTSAVAWSTNCASGQQMTRTHSYADSGVYHLKVKARDAQLAESDWSQPLDVSVAWAVATPHVFCEAVDGGVVLRLHWTAVTSAESYEVRVDDSLYMTTDTSFDVSVPATSIEVASVRGDIKSDPAVINCTVVESTVEFFGDLASTHANGFGFDAGGSAVACTLEYPDFLKMDFFADYGGWKMKLVNAGVITGRRKGDALKPASGSYDDATIADSLGAYSDTLVIKVDSTYYLRISADTTGTWSTNDNFAKARVDSIVEDKVSLTTGFQRLGGLRWLRSQ